MPGVLYIVATPIGNLQDISARAIATLRAVDLIAAEDTRHSGQLLRHLQIDTRMLSYHEHNETSRSDELVARLLEDQDVALISDAGTPLISDPGYSLVRAARQAGIRVSPIPGANSVATALCAAGLPTDQFHFFGFLPARAAERKSRLLALSRTSGTLVMFESSHRIAAMLQQLAEVFPHQSVVVAKELTKIHEQFLVGSAAEVLQRLLSEQALTRGEFVVLVDNGGAQHEERPESDDIRVMKTLLQEVSVKTAVKIAAKITGRKKNEVYELALRLQNEAGPASGD